MHGKQHTISITGKSNWKINVVVKIEALFQAHMCIE